MSVEYPQLGLFIDGHWITTARNLLPVISPRDAAVIANLPLARDDDVDEAIAAADRSFSGWRGVPAYQRSALLHKVGALIREREAVFARAISLELGKPLAEARHEAHTAADMFVWAAEECRRSYGRVIPARRLGQNSQAIWEPVGPVAAFAPWNAPAITPARKIAATLAAGCTLVLKAAEETPASAILLVRALEDAGLPNGVVNLLFGDPAAISQKLLSAPQIKAMTFTGSTQVGKLLAAQAGANLKRMTLELGGHAPVLVFDDCDVDAVAMAAVAAKFRNSGQVCTSPTRFYVQETVYERFASRFVALAKDWRVGDPFEDNTQMGPVATQRRLESIASLTEDARQRGVEVAAGGTRLDKPGYYWTPTVLTGADDDCLASNEEPFGPLALIAPMRDLDEALFKANRLPQALAAYAFTRCTDIIATLRDELNCGTLAVNHWQASWPETPFGGRGASGFGIEGGVEGLQAFQQIKFISVAER